MNNIPSSHNYINDGTNLHYSVGHQLIENNVNQDSSTLPDYYDQHSYQQRNHPTHYSQIYQENANQLYRYPSTTQK